MQREVYSDDNSACPPHSHRFTWTWVESNAELEYKFKLIYSMSNIDNKRHSYHSGTRSPGDYCVSAKNKQLASN